MRGRRIIRYVAGSIWRLFWHVLSALAYQGREYTYQVPSGRRVYTPWFASDSHDEFTRLLRLASVSGPYLWKSNPDRSYMLYQLCRACLAVGGDMAECGVATGGTAHLLCLLLDEHHPHRTLHLFDTFAGMPATTLVDRDSLKPGDHFGSLIEVKKRLERFPFARFHVGFIPDTFREVADVPSFAFVHVNVTSYQSTIDCCTWFWPKLCTGGIMLVGEYGLHPVRNASRAAVDDFARDKGENVIVLPSAQAMLIKR